MSGNHDGSGCASNFPVAVVGIAGRFPDAADVRTFWANLCAGRNPIKTIPSERWDWRAYDGEVEDGKARTYANSGGFAPFIDRFDAAFFDVLPREAQSMDPQQRLFLQTCFAALEDAGIAPSDLAGTNASVFAGVGFSDYQARMRQDGAPYDTYRGTGIVPAAIANRVSFALDLRGPSETIDTACSGSLIAVHRAIQSLRLGESSVAIAGGVNLLIGPELFIAFSQAGMLSRAGRCRTFDAGADGYVRGEGVGALVLRPLADAQRDGDFIYGVLRGSAVNHGGKAHSFTAPNIAAQAALVASAWQMAERDIADAVLIETHGTGTPLGDPIEIEGLKRTLGAARHDANKVALGALKTNIGHLEGAAGIAGLIKALLVLHYRYIPANLHFESLNPKIDLKDTPFYIPASPVAFDRAAGAQLTAGVSSFGFGGANAHVVVESYQNERPDQSADHAVRPYLFVLSARTREALAGRARQLATYLNSDHSTVPTSIEIRDVAQALGITDARADAHDASLADLGISLETLIVALCRIGQKYNGELNMSDVRDCVTLRELTARIRECLSDANDLADPGDDILLPGVAIRDDLRISASVAAISYSLMHGRDAMSERLAIVAQDRDELLAQLRRYITQPDQQSPTLFWGSVRRAAVQAEAEHPVDAAPNAGVAPLCGHAQQWVRSRTAVLNWSEIHGGEAPAKLPLPSYPFALKRHWYVAEDAEQSRIQAKSKQGAIAAAKPLPAAKSNSHAAGVSCSVLGLAKVLDELSQGTPTKCVHVASLAFGAPLVANGSDLKVVCVTSGGRTTAQCLIAKSGGAKVIMQALVSKEATTQPAVRRRGEGRLEHRDIDAALKQCGLQLTADDIAIVSAYRDTNYVRCEVRNAEPRTTRDVFQNLLMALLAGHSVMHGDARGVPHFFRAAKAGCDASQLGSSIIVTMERSANGLVSFVAASSGAAPALWIDGLEIKAVIESEAMPTGASQSQKASSL